jgi:Ca2+-binding RTX toxin-like protein
VLGANFAAQVSADGRYVIFSDGSNTIFRKDVETGALSIIVWMAASGAGIKNAQISADGRYVVFQSDASFGSDDEDAGTDTYLKDLATGTLTLLSTAADGSNLPGRFGTPQISDDGRYVLFDSGGDDPVSHVNIYLVDLFYKPYGAAITEGRFIEVKLGTGAASSATIAWGDGTASTVAPAGGSAAFSHTYASAGTKAANVTLVEGALTWVVPHTVNLTAGTMARNTTLVDTLSGGAGGDVLTGDAFANHLIANGGNDRLNGGSGNDSLDGGAGNDVFIAGVGNDRLMGGLGKDTFTGNTGRDVFVFDDRDTGSSKSRADTITDFRGRSGDRLDLKLVDANTRKRGDQKFSFIGDDEAFTAAGQVRFEKTKGYTYVYLNTDSDRAAEAVIKLKGAMDLSKGWFVL